MTGVLPWGSVMLTKAFPSFAASCSPSSKVWSNSFIPLTLASCSSCSEEALTSLASAFFITVMRSRAGLGSPEKDLETTRLIPPRMELKATRMRESTMMLRVCWFIVLRG